MQKRSTGILLKIISAAVILTMSGCSAVNSQSKSADDSGTAESTAITEYLAAGDMFSSRDSDPSYDEATAYKIQLSDDGVKTDCTSMLIAKSTVTVTAEGTYIFSGSLSAGQIIVDAPDTAKVQVVLNGVNISNVSTAPLYVREADKVFVTLADGSNNTLSVTGEFAAIDDNNIDAAVFSKSDLTLNGNGTLAITDSYGHGIVSKDDLAICGGNITINALKHGIAGKDSVKISGGTFDVTSGKDGIHSENSDDAAKGYVYISGGTFNIKSDGDGIDAAYTTQIENGDFTLTCGGGASSAAKKTDDMFGGGFRNTSTTQSSGDSDDSVSVKGIKGTGSVVINSGTFNINSADDAVHSNENAEINGGTFTIATGDDGVHADYNVLITAGDINITKSYEGIEGLTIDINGGNITLEASDDGLNAAGGNDQSGFGGGNIPGTASTSTSGSYIKITGGVLRVNAVGDGIDSNGALYVTGGDTVVEGPENSGNGALDYDSTAQITGGTFIALGASGMAQGFDSTSTQGTILATMSSSMSTGEITLKDSSGNTVMSYTPKKSYNSVVLSCADIKQGETYTLSAAGQTQTIEMSQINYGGSGSGRNGGGQMQPGSFGGGNDGTQNTPPDGSGNFGGGSKPSKTK